MEKSKKELVENLCDKYKKNREEYNELCNQISELICTDFDEELKPIVVNKIGLSAFYSSLNLDKAFGVKVRKAREKKGMSTYKVANEISIYENSLRTIEAVGGKLNNEIKKKLCQVLDID